MDFTQKKFRNIETDELEFSPQKDERVYWRPSGYGIITNSDNQILLVIDSRSQKWEFPGGGVDLGETPQEGVVREVLEETGYTCELIKSSPLFLDVDYFYHPRKKEFYSGLTMIFRGVLRDTEKKDQNFSFEGEITEVGWFTLDEIKSLDIAEFHKEVFERLEEFI